MIFVDGFNRASTALLRCKIQILRTIPFFSGLSLSYGRTKTLFTPSSRISAPLPTFLQS
jgi:hypothetical protein